VKIALGVEYEGTSFCGWQTQASCITKRSIQTCLVESISQVANMPVIIVGAGRTDAGVHAIQQVLHFETVTQRSIRTWVFGINAFLPPEIRILWAKIVPDHFDARRSALSRRYRYVIYNHALRPSLLRHYVTWIPQALNAERMHQAAQHWVGEWDFSSFRARGCQSRSPVRRVDEIQVERRGHLIYIEVRANAFLYHMVRNMVGVLLKIGQAQAMPEWALEVLYERRRSAAGVTAPPQGLYLLQIEYPAEFKLPVFEEHIEI
jgi:tRNA pseudouridine38-40 synthase